MEMTKEKELKMILSFIGFSEVILGDSDKEDFHRHRCGMCGFVWEHVLQNIKDGHYEIAHTCPVCRTEQRERYQGSAVSECTYDGINLEWKVTERTA